MIPFGLVANICEEVNGLSLHHQTNIAFDLDFGSDPPDFFLLSERWRRRMRVVRKQKGKHTQIKVNSQRRQKKNRTKGKKDKEEWINVRVRMRSGSWDLQEKLIFLCTTLFYYSISSGKYDTCCEAQIAPHICSEADASHCGCLSKSMWESKRLIVSGSSLLARKEVTHDDIQHQHARTVVIKNSNNR